MNDSLMFCRFVLCFCVALAGVAHATPHAASRPHPQDDARSAIAEDAIGGVVLDQDGAPLAGVTVGLRHRRAGFTQVSEASGGPLFDGGGGDLPCDTLAARLERMRNDWRPSLDEALAAAEAAWRAERGDVFETTTDANGAFLFEGLTEHDPYALEYSLSGYSFRRSRGQSARRSQHLAVVGQKLHRIDFEFVGEDGLVFDQVFVRRYQGGLIEFVSSQRLQSSLELGPDTETLQFLADGPSMREFGPLGEYASEPITIDPGDPALANGPVRVELRRRAWVTLQLDDPWSARGGGGGRHFVATRLADGEEFDAAVFAARVRATRYSAAQGSSMASYPDFRVARQADSAWRVVYGDLERGRYVFGVCDNESRLLVWREFTLEDPGSLVTLRPPQPTPGDRLVLKLVNVHGERLGAVPQLFVDERVDGMWRAVEHDVLTSPFGEHWIALDAVAPEASALRIGALHWTHGLVYEEIATDVRALELVYPRWSTLDLAVVDLDPSVLTSSISANLEYVGPYLDTRGEREPRSPYLVLDGHHGTGLGPDGRTTVSGLAPGTWRVWFEYVIDGNRTVRVDGGDVQLEPGATHTLEVSAPKLTDLDVRTATTFAGRELVLFAASEPREVARTRVDALGGARFVSVPIGAYRLGVMGGHSVDHGSLTDVVVDGTPIEWRLQ